MLDIIAGSQAYQRLEQEGLNPSQFSTFLGASGGPKWFCLFGLDKYLFGEFFNGRTQPLNMLGSSAGAFRSACFGQNDPVAAISRLAHEYSHTRYSDKVDAVEISTKARELLDVVFGSNGAREIIDNPVFKAHFIVAKAQGLVASENRYLQLAGLLKSYGLNRINRRLIKKQYQRLVFHPPGSSLQIDDPYGFATKHVPLTDANIKQALLASGSIPLVMQGLRDIPGAEQGMYRDGGIIDYHFDVGLNHNSGLILYPHFSHNPKAGWFDKNLKRSVNPKHYDNVVMLVPSKAFVASLPYGKIPDRDDFKVLDADTRLTYWQQVFAATEQLAEDMDKYVSDRDYLLSRLKPFPFIQ